MVGMTRRVVGDEDPSCGLRLLPVIQDFDPVLRHGTRLTPELVHPLAVDAGGALYELRRVGKVRVADLVHVESRVGDRKSTRLNSSHANISYAVFCLKKKTAR